MMVPYKHSLSEEQRWQLINYIRSLGVAYEVLFYLFVWFVFLGAVAQQRNIFRLSKTNN